MVNRRWVAVVRDRSTSKAAGATLPVELIKNRLVVFNSYNENLDKIVVVSYKYVASSCTPSLKFAGRMCAPASCGTTGI